MTHPELTRITTGSESRLASGLRVLLPVGRGTARVRPTAAAFGLLLAALGLLLFSAGPAFASGPFHYEEKLHGEQIFSTRASLVAVLISEGNVPARWEAEYAPAEPGGEAPPPPQVPGEAPWVSAGGSFGAFIEGILSESIFVGLGHLFPTTSAVSQGGGVVHHLHPGTAYYARFLAQSKAGEEAPPALFKFTTLPLAKPEIPDGEPELAEAGNSMIFADATGPTSAKIKARIETNGSPTAYSFEYAPAEAGGARPGEASASWQPFTSEASGNVTVAEDFSDRQATATGLSPETTYFFRITATNAVGTFVQTENGVGLESFTTPTARPTVFEPTLRNVTATSVHLSDNLLPHGSETEWRFQYATSASGPWTDAPGAAGIVTQAEAEALPEGQAAEAEGRITGLAPATTYYVRLFAENAAGEARNGFGEPVSTETRQIPSFQTSGPPAVTAFAIHALDGESLRLLGSVSPNSIPTSEEQTVTVEGSPTGGTFTLTFKGQTTEPIPFDAPAAALRHALEGLSALGAGAGISVTGPAGGPFTVYFGGASGEVDQPQLETDPSGLTPSGSVAVSTTQAGGEGYDTHYHFEYEPVEAGVAAFSDPVSTAAVDLGAGHPEPGKPFQARAELVGATLPALTPGATYRYRLSAVNTSPGEPVVDGTERTLVVPVPAAVEPPASCPNAALRTGPSAGLPDCRAYEQLTPVEKGGAQEIYAYGGRLGVQFGFPGALPSLEGDRLMLATTTTRWGSGPTAGQSPYFFTRDPAAGWQLTAGAPQPEAGFDEYSAEVLAPDLSQMGFVAGRLNQPSSTVAFRAGPPGGPYATVATVPRSTVSGPLGREGGWVATSADFSKLILALEDRKLEGLPRTATVSGDDLYEYAAGALHQLNVNSAGKTLGTCGANLVSGREEAEPRGLAGRHAVSADGSRVFFDAYPGACPSSVEEKSEEGPNVDLYMRVGGAETVEIGNYRFLEADAAGATLLLAHGGELFRYDTETHALDPVPAGETLNPARYSYGFRLPPELSGFKAESGVNTLGVEVVLSKALFGSSEDLPQQILRYDSAQHLLQCLSCASPFDPEPKLLSVFGGESAATASHTFASADGDYVFFDTPAALLPQDVDGEEAPERKHPGTKEPPHEHLSPEYSLSSDVYEWRRDGLEGCSHLQGCLALITSGRGGYLNLLLGTDPSGRDVFFATRESLLPRDVDTASDIYDARIGGGFPEPSAPVPCEGDACFHPVPAPDDPTPGSATYHGPGNEHPRHHKKHRKRKKQHAKKHHKHHANHHRRAGK